MANMLEHGIREVFGKVQQLAEKNLSLPIGTDDCFRDALEAAHPVRRILAIMLDYLFCNWIVLSIKSVFCLAFEPARQFFALVPSDLFVFLLLINRDALFGGRGLAKQLLMLRVFDKNTSQPVRFRQSIVRNSVLFGSCFLLQLAMILIPTSSFWDKIAVLNCLGFVSSCYVVIVFICETALMFWPGKERIGDKLADTTTFRDTSTCLSNF